MVIKRKLVVEHPVRIAWSHRAFGVDGYPLSHVCGSSRVKGQVLSMIHVAGE